MSPEEFKEREEKRNEGFVRTFHSWKQTFYLIVTHIIHLEEKGVSEEIKEMREEHGMFGIMDIADDLTNKFEEQYRDEDWDEKDYILTTEEFIEERLKK